MKALFCRELYGGPEDYGKEQYSATIVEPVEHFCLSNRGLYFI